jgi:phosphate transport system substrate-binding protein
MQRQPIPVLLVVLSMAGACSGGTPGPGGSRADGLVRVDGSSTVFPVTEAVAEEFQNAGGARVTVGISGTGGGFQKFCRGETDISDASRPIRAQELDVCRAAGIDFIELPVAYDGLAVVVNPRNTWAAHMTVAELKRLWEPAAEKRILRWNQIRTGWPDREVRLFGAGADSGTFDYFTEAIVGQEKASRGDFTASEDDNVLVQGVAGDEQALGFFGLAYYEENKDKLKLVAVDDGDPSNGDGPILPSLETVRGGTYRPLSRPLFIYVSTRGLERAEVKAFVDYYLAHVSTLVGETGYVPLSDRELQLVAGRWEARRTGTMYTGTHGTETLEQRLTGQ